MNILFVYYLPSGGVETLNRQRINALQKRGINCHLLYLKSGSGSQNIHQTPTFITNFDTDIKKILHLGNFDVVVVCSDYTFPARLRKLGYTGKIIFEIQGLGSVEDAENILKEIRPRVVPFCDGLLYPKTSHLIEICEKYYPTMKHFCFHNLHDVRSFFYQEGPVAVQPIIGWVGRLEPNKNWSYFLKICYEIKKVIPAIQIWMFEDATLSTPSERSRFERMVKDLQLKDQIIIHSNIPHKEMANYYSRIGDSGGFLCSTSKVEGFGYAILEAMSCRCPVLSTDSDGVRAFIAHNETGKFIPQADATLAAHEGLDIISNLSLRETIRMQALEHIKKQFNPEDYCNNFIAMLHELK
ncbi:MAG: glycosyltransferase family 4 protein [Bacillaceae bacterium]|nr:glycosyltransferase family 4 protein [Bacillaceae bacterium]